VDESPVAPSEGSVSGSSSKPKVATVSVANDDRR
jgi:hypothetical protein